ncbi:hypothetical protein BC835DRAFT_1414834 [Cytidiella melzeri]|nr:hypothetical protein BC835DRAFT_1414834 [Cytidiella melzeri]
MSTPSTPLSPATRLVPGAPPPAAVAKSQKKKKSKSAKKTSEHGEEHVDVPDTQAAALINHAPSEGEIKDGSVAPELIVRSTSTRPVSPAANEKELRPSALVDMLNKRVKATNKKITRIQSYSTTPIERLNDDQVRSLKVLPVLEGVVKELEEVKKAVEVHEAEIAQEVAAIRAEAERAEEERVQDAVASAISLHRLKTADLLSIVSLQGALTSGDSVALAMGLSEGEAYAVFSAVESLLGNDSEKKAEVIRGFLSGEGNYQGVSYSRLLEITQLFTNPPPSVEPASVEPQVVVEFIIPEEPAQEDVVIQGVPASAGVGSSFTFVQEDELEGEDQEDQEPSDDDVEIIQNVTEVTANGHSFVQETVTITTTQEVSAANDNVGINWADEEDQGLPPISSLHDRFGSSSTGTPAPAPEPLPETPTAPMNGEHTENGFQAAHRGRGQDIAEANAVISVVVIVVNVAVADGEVTVKVNVAAGEVVIEAESAEIGVVGQTRNGVAEMESTEDGDAGVDELFYNGIFLGGFQEARGGSGGPPPVAA